jgi:hypothetical protein
VEEEGGERKDAGDGGGGGAGPGAGGRDAAVASAGRLLPTVAAVPPGRVYGLGAGVGGCRGWRRCSPIEVTV